VEVLEKNLHSMVVVLDLYLWMVCNVMELNHQYSPVLIKDGVCLILHAAHTVPHTPSRPTSTLPCPGVEPTSLTSIPEN
jgi:hypothetical protein